MILACQYISIKFGGIILWQMLLGLQILRIVVSSMMSEKFFTKTCLIHNEAQHPQSFLEVRMPLCWEVFHIKDAESITIQPEENVNVAVRGMMEP